MLVEKDYYEMLENNKEFNNTLNSIKQLIVDTRNKVYTTVNVEMLQLYWHIGESIVKIQAGNERAEYGNAVLKKLSQKLTEEFGKGFSGTKSRKNAKIVFIISDFDDTIVEIELVTLC